MNFKTQCICALCTTCGTVAACFTVVLMVTVHYTDNDTKLLYCAMLRLRMSEHGPSTRSKRVRSILTHFSKPRATTVAALGRSSNSAISPRATDTTISVITTTLVNVWQYSMVSLKIKLDLYTSLIVSTAIYASETWKSTARMRQQLDVFHRNLRKILGITWKDHVTNMEVRSRPGQRRLQDIVAERRLRTIRMPPGRPANHAMSWTPHGSGRRRGRPTKTWRSTFKEDLVDRGVDWNSVRAVATDRSRWRTLAAHCPVKDRRI